MTTQRNDSRWTEPIVAAIYRNGRAIDNPSLTKAENKRIRRVSRAWQHYRKTGDRSRLVKLGILPDDE